MTVFLLVKAACESNIKNPAESVVEMDCRHTQGSREISGTQMHPGKHGLVSETQSNGKRISDIDHISSCLSNMGLGDANASFWG